MTEADRLFARFPDFIKEYIYRRGWSELREIQAVAAKVIFESEDNLLLSSSTASGKTEAAFFPILTELCEKPSVRDGVSVLYIAPLKSLINDQFGRIEELLEECDIPVFHWHGDVGASHKSRLLKQPRGILQITPESLESMIINRSNDIPRVFGDLRYVVIDEIHTMIGTDRGNQVLCQLFRLQRLLSYSPRRIGLSATLGDLSGGISALHIRAVSESDARKEFLDKVQSLGLNDSLAYALYRTVNQSLHPNVIFDEQQTKLRRDEARRMIKDVIVKVRAGDTLVDSDTSPSPVISERLKAYKAELEKRGTAFSFTSGSVEFIFCLLIVTTGALFIVISKTQKNKQPRTIAIFCTLLLINLVLERTLVEMSNTEYFDSNTPLLQILAYVAPLMLGPIIQVLIFGSYTGFIMALMVSALTTLMLGEGIVYFIIFLASALVAIYFCASATSRPRVILGGVIYGLFISAISFIIGNCMGLPLGIVWRQSLLAVGSGAMTGLVALAVLPLIERIFNRYSNVTLLDYTDFNNPLLRRLQIEAPGTYHHSVMVSYLAEAAAVAAGANPMVCRVGALYHDIGKIQKPEFFSENQGGGKNVHDEKNPSMSALIIKNHIREGVEMAKIAKLPKQVIDAIEQHHGKSIISYFYNKAMKMAEAGEIKDPLQALRDAGIEESTYRHEGILPQTVESAIIMISDSCEAASRSLSRITQHGVEDLVNAIIRSKMTDGQLDECPITVKQLSKIKNSIVATMLNMFHTRVAYNNAKK